MGIVSTWMLLFPLRCVAILETNNQTLMLIPFMKIDERRTKRANLSLALDSLSFLIEFFYSLFVFLASKGTCRITTTYYYARNKDLNSQIM